MPSHKSTFPLSDFPIIRLAASLAIAFMLVYLLIVGRFILQPFVIALFLWFATNSIMNFYARLRVFGKLLPVWARIFLSVVTLFGAFALVFSALISVSVNEFVSKLGTYQPKIQLLFSELEVWVDAVLLNLTGTEFSFTDTLLLKMQNIPWTQWLSKIPNLANNAALVLSYLGIALLFFLFMLLEQRVFSSKLEFLFPNQKERLRIETLLKRIGESVYAYIKVKSFVSFLTAISTYIVLEIWNVDFAPFLAVLTYFLNFIPNIGSGIALLLSGLIALLQFSFIDVFIMVVILGAIQQFFGSYLDPKLSGDRLNLSPLVIILALVFWGKIWGILGAFLSVPLTVIINIILANFKVTRPIAVLLSSKGDVIYAKAKGDDPF